MRKCIFYLLFAIGFSSCVKDSVNECPAQFSIHLYVIDKNYSNVSSSKYSTSVDADLNFRNYVSDVYYILQDMETGEIVYHSNDVQVEDNSKEYLITFNSVANGRYILTVLGNIAGTEGMNGAEADLHPGESESTDIYLATYTLEFTSEEQTSSLGLERTKGKLQVVCNNFPDSITRIEMQVSPVYRTVSSGLTYSGQTEVIKSFPLTGSSSAVLETFLAPTHTGSNSDVSLSIFSKNNVVPLLTLPTVNASIKRNEIYTLEINYNDLQQAWEVWVQVDGKWEMIYQLALSEK